MSICGSHRYIPPEVALMEPYNESCDVYSLSIVLWEMLTLKHAFDKNASNSDMMTYVYNSPFKRPCIQDTWPTPIQVLFHKCWHPSPQARPKMKQVEECLNKQLIESPHTGI